MNRILGYLALVLASIGLAGCTAGVIAIWVACPSVLRFSDELFDTMDDGLQLVEQKTTAAAALVRKIQVGVAPLAKEITRLADKAASTPDDKRVLKRIRDGLSEHLDQVDALAEVAESAATLLDKSTRLGKSLHLPGSRISSGASPEDAQDRSVAVARVAKQLTDLRENLAKIQADVQASKEIVAAVVQAARDVDQNLNVVDSKLARLRQSSIDWSTKVGEWRTSVPSWINWTVGLGSVVLAWLGLGQFVLLRRAWASVRGGQSP